MSREVLFEGPDISVYQGVVDMKRIRNAGCKMVALRAGYGKNNIDQRYIANAQALYNLGIPGMLYWFSYAFTVAMAAMEAVYAIAQAKKFWKKCPIAFDGEYDTVRWARTQGVEIGKTLMTDMAIAFLVKVKEEGFIPVLYTNRDYILNYFDLDRIAAAVGDFYIWYARYNMDELPAAEQDIPDLWQYTSKGKLDGVNGNVDMNRFYVDFTTLCVPVEQDKSSTTCNINIQNFQKAANADGYLDSKGRKLDEDGIDGANTQYVRKQILLRIKKEGARYVTISQGEVVRWVQTRCNEILGTSLELNGEYDAETRAAVLQVQEKLNLEVDEIVGYNTIQALFYN